MYTWEATSHICGVLPYWAQQDTTGNKCCSKAISRLSSNWHKHKSSKRQRWTTIGSSNVAQTSAIHWAIPSCPTLMQLYSLRQHIATNAPMPHWSTGEFSVCCRRSQIRSRTSPWLMRFWFVSFSTRHKMETICSKASSLWDSQDLVIRPVNTESPLSVLRRVWRSGVPLQLRKSRRNTEIVSGA